MKMLALLTFAVIAFVPPAVSAQGDGGVRHRLCRDFFSQSPASDSCRVTRARAHVPTTQFGYGSIANYECAYRAWCAPDAVPGTPMNIKASVRLRHDRASDLRNCSGTLAIACL